MKFKQDAERKIKYPFEPIKDWYLSPLGGRSVEIGYDEVGLNETAIEENTDLVPFQDTVMISKLDNKKTIPLYFKKLFTVVPVGKERPDALSKSPNGEVVLPPKEPTIVKKPKFMDPISKNEILILNSVLSKRIG